MPEKCALYARVSTEEQAEKGVSIDAQIDYLKRWAEEEEYEIVEIYRDEGYSGSTIARPELLRMLEDAEKRKFDVVLCYHNDRLSRDTKEALEIVQILSDCGVQIRFSNIDVDLSTPEGEMLFTMVSAFATYFRKDLIRKTKLGMHRLKEMGFWIGKVPKLFDRDYSEGHLRIFPSLKALVMYEMKVKGFTYRAIADIFSESYGVVYRTVKILDQEFHKLPKRKRKKKSKRV